MAKKTTEELEAESRRLRQDAETWNTHEVSSQREEAYQYYYGETYGDERSGRSDIVTREVYDAVEWIKPELVRIFTSGDRVVEFTPQGPEDVESAQQETDYINYVFMRKNPGFSIIHDWVADGLMQKNGVVKWYWDDSVETTEECYTNLTLEEATFLAEQHPDMELESFEYTEQEIDGIIVQGTEAEFKVRKNKPCAKVVNVPPEEFLISRDARSINDATYVAHKKMVTRSELLYMGFTEEQLAGITFSDNTDSLEHMEYNARHSFDQTHDTHTPYSGDESQRKVWLYEEYFYSDIDGSGMGKLIKCFTVDDQVIEWEETCERPFASIAPLRLQHKYHGLSIHDILRDIQRTKSTLTRAMLDNASLMNNGRVGAVEGQVNIQDLLDNRPNGVVRLKNPNALVPLPSPTLDPNTFALFDYMDQMAEARSGVSKTSIGLDANALRSNVAASTVSQTMSAAMQKRELMARIIAETGFKDLFIGLHGLIKRNAKEADYVRLSGKYVKVDPTSWRDRADLTVSVGLGNGNRESQLQSYLSMTQTLQMFGAAMPQLFSPENIYEWAKKGFDIYGYKDADKYITNPANVPPPEPQPDPEMVKIQARQEEVQIKAQVDMAKNAETQRHNQAMEELAEAEVLRKTMKDEEDIAIDRQELRLEAQQGRPVAVGD